MPDLSDYTDTTRLARIFWFGLFVIGIVYEIITLPGGHRDTLSHAIWDNVRWTNLRFIFIPFMLWLLWHWVVRTQETVDHKDLIVLGIGFIYAIIDHQLFPNR